MANIDRVRIFALVGIVVFHATDFHIFGGAALPTFLLFTVALNARPRRSEGASGFIKRKAFVFLLPWAAWSIVYAISQTAAAKVRGDDPFSWFHPEMLIVGTQRHLWYMIFALIASLAAFFGYRATSRIGELNVVIGGALVAFIVMLLEPFFHVSESWEADWLVAAPAIPLGLALGRCVHAKTSKMRIRRTLVLASITIPVLAAMGEAQIGFNASRYALALVPVCLVVIWPGRTDPFTSWLTNLRLGVYLGHMLILRGMHFLGADDMNVVFRAIVAVVGSFALTLVLTRTPLAWMVLPNRLLRKS